MSLREKIAYAGKILPAATWRALGMSPRGPVHLIMALADHFEPAIDPENGQKRVSKDCGPLARCRSHSSDRALASFPDRQTEFALRMFFAARSGRTATPGKKSCCWPSAPYISVDRAWAVAHGYWPHHAQNATGVGNGCAHPSQSHDASSARVVEAGAHLRPRPPHDGVAPTGKLNSTPVSLKG